MSRKIKENRTIEKRPVEKGRTMPKPVLFFTLGIFAALVIGLIAIIYHNSAYKMVTGSFDYKLEANMRKYEFVNSNGLDMFRIKDMKSADVDCYVYVGTYDPEQDLQETLDIINENTGTDYVFMRTEIGSKKYPAIFVDYRTEEGGNFYIYYVDYHGMNFVIQTLADDRHQKEIDKMVDSFTIIE